MPSACHKLALLLLVGSAACAEGGSLSDGGADSSSNGAGPQGGDGSGGGEAPASCADGTQNFDESDVDCGGGECPGCDIGQSCASGSDCESDYCNASLCAHPECGDAVKNGSEDCDPGGAESGVCDADCTAVACGDAYVNATAGETCDDGNAVTDSCTYGVPSCTVCGASCSDEPGIPTVCGDSVVDAANEACDDGNTATEACAYGQTSCMVCAADCTSQAGATSFCGDGTIDSANGESCEDGNTVAGDGCSATCTLECQPATFTVSGSAPECWCSATVSTTTVTVAGYAEVITNTSTSLNAGCNSCAPYTTTIQWLPVGSHTLTSQAVPCTCDPSSLSLVGVYAIAPVCGP